MRKVGEIGFSRMGQAKKCPRAFRKVEAISCKRCGVTKKLSLAAIRAIGGYEKYLCWDCKEKDKAEVNAALIAMANRR